MSLKIPIHNNRQFIIAVSGVFISNDNPNGLTKKEINCIAFLMKYSENGIITKKTRDQVIEKLDVTPQTFYNIMSILKGKKVIIKNQLHRIFTTNSITITREV